MDVEAMNIDALSISGHKVQHPRRYHSSLAQTAYVLRFVA